MTVVVGVDNSEASKAALRLAAQEARWRQAPLVAVSAYEPPIGPTGGFPGAAMHTEGKSELLLRHLSAPPLTTNSGIKPGQPSCAFPRASLDA